MSRRRTVSTKKKIALLVSAATVAGGGAFVMASTSNASQAPSATVKSAADSTVCQGLATALGNNQRFIDGQRANPDAQSEARIANREAVIKQIKVQQEASGCAVGESAQGSQAAQPSAPAGGTWVRISRRSANRSSRRVGSSRAWRGVSPPSAGTASSTQRWGSRHSSRDALAPAARSRNQQGRPRGGP